MYANELGRERGERDREETKTVRICEDQWVNSYTEGLKQEKGLLPNSHKYIS